MTTAAAALATVLLIALAAILAFLLFQIASDVIAHARYRHRLGFTAVGRLRQRR